MPMGHPSSDRAGVGGQLRPGEGGAAQGPQKGGSGGGGLVHWRHTAEMAVRETGSEFWPPQSPPLPPASQQGHVGTLQLQQSDLPGALEGFRELPVKSTQLPGWRGKRMQIGRGPRDLG